MTLEMAKIDTNSYCGPTAISIVTGCFSSEAAAALRSVSGKRQIKGASEVHMVEALGLLGWPAIYKRIPRVIKIMKNWHPPEQRVQPTFGEFMKMLAMPGPWRYPTICVVGLHYIITDGVEWIDNSRVEPGDIWHNNGPKRRHISGIILHR